MVQNKVPTNDCDALDLSALWPCTAQIGCLPLSDLFPAARSRDTKRDEDDGERRHGIW